MPQIIRDNRSVLPKRQPLHRVIPAVGGTFRLKQIEKESFS
jgi:hypothetical protein